MNEPEPCRICGGRVRIARHREDSLAGRDAGTDVRECTNPSCPKNTGDASMTDVV